MSEKPMPDTVMPFPKDPLRPLPEPISTVSERGLGMVVTALKQQHGPVGAYNLLVGAAEDVRHEIVVPERKGKGRKSTE